MSVYRGADDQDSRPGSPEHTALISPTDAHENAVSYLSAPRNFKGIGPDGDEQAFEDSVNSEHLTKKGALLNIQRAAKLRSNSDLLDTSGSVESDKDNKVSNEQIDNFSPRRRAVSITDNKKEDIRDGLFDEIPEAYPHKTNYQKVVISEDPDAEEDLDRIESCKKLKQCMDLRNKWLDAHPYPPQDIVDHAAELENGFRSAPSLSKLERNAQSGATIASSSPGKDKGKKEFRRRKEPQYNVFDQPLPSSVNNLRFNMVKGVMVVKETLDSLAQRERNNETFQLSYSEDAQDGKSPLAGAVRKALELSPDAVPPGESEEEDVQDAAQWDGESLYAVDTFEHFVDDFYTIRRVVNFGGAGSYAYKRLSILQAKFSLHVLLNQTRETDAQKSVPHRDFYNVRKVDTHVHHSACMNQKHLLRFIKHKLRVCPDEAVVFRDGQFLTLGEVFKSLNLTAYDLSIDTLDMHANNTFHRFDRFNLKYNPAGQSRLREIFLKTDNVISGRYLAEITKEVMSDLDQSKYQLVEWRLSIYGRKSSEWATLARWVYVNQLVNKNVRWLIQIPRLYQIYKKGGEIRNFGQMLNNIFAPLFAVSIDPASNPPLHYFLQTVVGFDSVDDESKPEHDRLSYGKGGLPAPEAWDGPNNPPYAYWMYYTYANICVLNKLRAARGLCTFQFRPHCGEAGDPDHLIATYLVAHQINHGILLRKNAGLQYLYYLSQVGMALSPLSNNKLFLDYNKSPFLKYFQIGMNVTLSTDDPLMLHYTKDALLEEYSVAAQVWKLTATDQCEIARRSVLQSGWEDKFKRHFLGEDYSDIRETNVPEIRLAYRRDALENELEALKLGQTSPDVPATRIGLPPPMPPPPLTSRSVFGAKK